jgi:MFS family permease
VPLDRLPVIFRKPIERAFVLVDTLANVDRLPMLSKSQEYRRAWPTLVASALGSGVGLAPIGAYSLGALVAPLTTAFGWSRADIGAAALFLSLGILAAGAGVGALADRFGARPIALISQGFLVAGLAALILINRNIFSLYAGYFALAVLGAGTLPMIWGRAVIGWFVNGRGFALGLSLVGTGVVGAFLPSYVSGLSAAAGWRGAYLGIAALPLLIGLPITALFFREPSKPEIAADHTPMTVIVDADYTFRQAVSTLCFWQMTVALVIVAIAVSGVLVHTLPLMTDRGIGRGTAAALAGLFGIAVTLGRLVSGSLLDVFRHPLVGSVMFAVPAAACLLFMVSGSNIVLSAAAILCIGLAAGTESDVAAYLVAKYFGRANYGVIYGLLYTLFGVGAGLGPLLVGAVYDKTGSYNPALAVDAVIFLIAAILIGTLRAPKVRSGALAKASTPAQPFN